MNQQEIPADSFSSAKDSMDIDGCSEDVPLTVPRKLIENNPVSKVLEIKSPNTGNDIRSNHGFDAGEGQWYQMDITEAKKLEVLLQNKIPNFMNEECLKDVTFPIDMSHAVVQHGQFYGGTCLRAALIRFLSSLYLRRPEKLMEHLSGHMQRRS